MNTRDLIIQQSTNPRHLVLLFHGVGSNARDLVPLGEALAPHLPDATIVSAQAPEAAGRGWQWFSVQGVTEADRPARVAAAMPGFVQAVRQWQEAAAVRSAGTTLIGFSQGAIMAPESTQLAHPAGQPGGRAVRPFRATRSRGPRVGPHASAAWGRRRGDARASAVDALAQLRSLCAFATLDRFPGLGHGIDGRVVDAIVRRLNDVVPAPI